MAAICENNRISVAKNENKWQYPSSSNEMAANGLWRKKAAAAKTKHQRKWRRWRQRQSMAYQRKSTWRINGIMAIMAASIMAMACHPWRYGENKCNNGCNAHEIINHANALAINQYASAYHAWRNVSEMLAK